MSWYSSVILSMSSTRDSSMSHRDCRVDCNSERTEPHALILISSMRYVFMYIYGCLASLPQ